MSDWVSNARPPMPRRPLAPLDSQRGTTNGAPRAPLPEAEAAAARKVLTDFFALADPTSAARRSAWTVTPEERAGRA